uniref:Predicted protein n=1 Tax=Hordeum vulgare subsp. vulgare TaxID=112509 RepID=F2DVL9_HORVV|nr:predicted protein [Hordeum vulgare subsp. vulgare]
MVMISVSFLFVVFNALIVPVYSQTCQGTAVYAPCSSNSACGCFPMVTADNFGVCGFLWLTCARLTPCQGTNDYCEQPDHVCVRHPRCQNQPVCYPLQMIDQRVCPPPTNIPVDTTTPLTTTPEITMTTTAPFTETTMTTTVSFTETTMTTTIQTTTTPSASVKPADNICATATWSKQGITVAGGGGTYGSAYNRLNYPDGIFIGKNQTVYVADTDNNRVMKWVKNATVGVLVAGYGGSGTNSSQLRRPKDVVVDGDETVYVTDHNNNRVQKWLRNSFRAMTILNLANSYGIALDDEETLYVSASSGGYIYQQRKGASKWESIGNNGTQVQHITIDKNGAVIGVTTQFKQVLIKHKNQTKFYYIADGSEEYFLNPSFDPYSAIVDQSGYVYALERSNNRVTRWSPGAKTGTVIIGGRGAGSAAEQLNSPTDITFDDEGNIYIADTYNHRVQKFLINKSSCN